MTGTLPPSGSPIHETQAAATPTDIGRFDPGPGVPASAGVTLTVRRGRLAPAVYEFHERASCIVGRATGCSPQLPNDEHHRTVSRHHCLLDINPPQARIRDFGSLNGTFVNGEKIGQRLPHQSPAEGAALPLPEHDLRDGDEICLGDTVFAVHIQLPPDHPTESVVLCAQCHHQLDLLPDRAASAQLCPECAARGGLARNPVDLAGIGHRDLEAISGYFLLRELGSGGMGAVYLAENNETGRQVALKVLLPQASANPDARARFLREADLCATLRHRNIVSIHDTGFADGVFYFTTEYCPGGSLDKLLLRRGGTLATPDALRLICHALQGLAHAHHRGLVHRDLSPHNLLLSGTDAAPLAKIGDFGLAKAFDQAGLGGLTRTGTIAGKPGHIPRQQVLDFRGATPAVDLWAITSCLYLALTGSYPREFPPGKDPWLMILETDPVPIRRRAPHIPPALADVIDRALAEGTTPSPYSTAQHLHRALHHAYPGGKCDER
ncbi:protein kinase [Nocardia sp. NPDC051750]|uniref:protein kinase domain-containing protein n=1 Tax=Nocardia sp. NPDC051750 TaxID=3364325 RepID=UPI0037A752D3